MKDKNQPYKNLDELKEKMFSCAFSMPPTFELPKTNSMDFKVKLPEKPAAIYKQIRKEGATEFANGYMTVDNILTQAIRLQQITSGYLALENDSGEKWLERISTYRRTALLRYIQGIPESEPIVVFAKFKKDLLAIRKVCERLGCGYSEVSGRENTLSEWKQGNTRVIGVQYGSGSEGINLTRAHICIFYSLEQSLAKYEQAIKRIHRPGQKKPCLYVSFVATSTGVDTIDQKICRSLQQKKNLVDLIMEGKENL